MTLHCLSSDGVLWEGNHMFEVSWIGPVWKGLRGQSLTFGLKVEDIANREENFGLFSENTSK